MKFWASENTIQTLTKYLGHRVLAIELYYEFDLLAFSHANNYLGFDEELAYMGGYYNFYPNGHFKLKVVKIKNGFYLSYTPKTDLNLEMDHFGQMQTPSDYVGMYLTYWALMHVAYSDGWSGHEIRDQYYLLLNKVRNALILYMKKHPIVFFAIFRNEYNKDRDKWIGNRKYVNNEFDIVINGRNN